MRPALPISTRRPSLKPSGIEWLGDVPEHWEVIENRRLFRERDRTSASRRRRRAAIRSLTSPRNVRTRQFGDYPYWVSPMEFSITSTTRCLMNRYKTCYTGEDRDQHDVGTGWEQLARLGLRDSHSPSYNVYTPTFCGTEDCSNELRRLSLPLTCTEYVLVHRRSESRGIWTSRLQALTPSNSYHWSLQFQPMEEVSDS